MKTLICCLLLSSAFGNLLSAAPSITANGIVNAASFKPVGVPGSPLARGALGSIFGTGLGPSPGVNVSAFPLQNTLAGVSIKATQGTTTVNLLPIYVSAGQVNFVLPSNTPLGQVQVTVTYNSETSPAATLQVVPVSFGIFTRAGGTGQAIVQNFVSQTELPLNTPANSARIGQTLIVYGTGLGAISGPDNVAPPAGDVTVQPFEILVGGVVQKRAYAGRSPCCSGLDQVVFEIVPGTPTGCYVPLMVRAGEFVSNSTSIAVSAAGGVCSDPANPLSSIITTGGTRKVGAITLDRTALRFSLLGTDIDSTTDTASAVFFRFDETFSNAGYTVPPPGTCNVFTFRSNDATQNPVAPPLALLDAGNPLRLTGPNGDKTIPRGDGNVYSASLGGGTPIPGGPPVTPLYLTAGRHTVTGPGGTDVGSFTAAIDLQTPLTWTNRDQISSVNRSQGLPITWSGGGSGDFVTIVGISTDTTFRSGGYFYCTAPVPAGAFTVPSAILSNLPASTSQSGIPTGLLLVGTSSYGNATKFTANGLDAGFLSASSSSGKLVAYQ